MTTFPTWDDPVAQVMAEADRLGAILATEYAPYPMLAIARGRDIEVAVDAYGVLVGVAVQEPVASSATLTAEARRLVGAARDALTVPQDEDFDAAERYFDDSHPFPSVMDRLRQFPPREDVEEVTPERVQEQVSAIAGTITGHAVVGAVRATVGASGTIIGLVFGDVDDMSAQRLNEDAVLALRAAAADAVEQAREAVAKGLADPAWPHTQLLLDNPYGEPAGDVAPAVEPPFPAAPDAQPTQGAGTTPAPEEER